MFSYDVGVFAIDTAYRGANAYIVLAQAPGPGDSAKFGAIGPTLPESLMSMETRAVLEELQGLARSVRVTPQGRMGSLTNSQLPGSYQDALSYFRRLNPTGVRSIGRTQLSGREIEGFSGYVDGMNVTVRSGSGASIAQGSFPTLEFKFMNDYWAFRFTAP